MTEALFGLETGQDEAARIMFGNRWIKSDWLAVEAALYRGKWFDYRYLNPVQATYLYAHEFVKAYKQAYSVNIDTGTAQFIKPLNVEKMFVLPEQKQDETDKAFRKRLSSHKMRTVGIWRGRMVADAMGIPYPVYLELAFHWSLRYWQQRHLPRPQQLYSDLVVDRATIAWEERQQAEFYYSALPQYKNGAYLEATRILADADIDSSVLHNQNQHHEWIFAQCENRVNGHEILAQMVFHDQVLPLEKVKARLDEHGFERFLSFAGSEPRMQRYS
jgi:hypothetical protein